MSTPEAFLEVVGTAEPFPEIPEPPSPLPPPFEPSPCDGEHQKPGNRVLKWMLWHDNRFTKIKQQRVWLGWQAVCAAHTLPGRASDKCNRSRNLRSMAGIDEKSIAFQAESERTITILKHWLVMGTPGLNI